MYFIGACLVPGGATEQSRYFTAQAGPASGPATAQAAASAVLELLAYAVAEGAMAAAAASASGATHVTVWPGGLGLGSVTHPAGGRAGGLQSKLRVAPLPSAAH